MRILVLTACLAVVALTGCGHSAPRDRDAIKTLLIRSNATYLYYTSPLWWGTAIRPRLVRIGIDGSFALAKIHVPGGPRIYRDQWVLLERGPRDWKLVATVLGRAYLLPCAAPADVARRLAGGCSHDAAPDPRGVVTGPLATRPPTANERRTIIKAARAAIFAGRDACVRYSIAVSRLDGGFASVSYSFHKPYGNCLLGNGISIFKKSATGWKNIGSASDPFPCSYLPPGVVRSLFGECWTG